MYFLFKKVLKYFPVNDAGYPFFKNMSFKIGNLIWNLVRSKQIEKHLKTTNHNRNKSC